MRVVSWIVVIVSIAWLAVFNLGSVVIDESSLPEVNMEQVTGTIAPTPHAAAAAAHQDFARRYTAAWNSHDPSRVAEHYAADGRIVINGGEPYVGIAGITQMADGFLTDFPDLDLSMNALEAKDGTLVYHWTFTGTHAETGHRVRINGSETWRLGEDGLIAHSVGRFDAEDYARQVAEGHQP